MLYIVLLAMVTAFLALRLYSVLGKRTGHEQPIARPVEDRAVAVTVPRVVEAKAEAREDVVRPIDAKAEAGLRAVIAGEPGFDVARFVAGAQSAYRMTLEAFWSGDEATLTELATPDVRDAFGQAIAARREAGETLENRLVSIESARIADAGVSGRDAWIAVRFDADIVAITRDADGQVIAGSMTDAVETHDVWTFSRTLKSADPNWTLSDTDEA
ncbi:Predicted lipid-binding transport protein, Tim44 family [Sphingomonas gellani]|uniref:Predicted lipid-binding transport protein, Tim44 family n=1 Tax=Sphingomonas gellani TaxID=1166340 RepID=A0A1H7Y122_9SPHN|nr:Tim44/TimA family putative adaptor protein [Sphingomonas gellani]SEM39574.1 Predicted lipid-binding transport protein, Tim44 family [Sphingomonas gellani]